MAGRRSESLKGVPIKEGKDRDEYPPAFSKEGGKGASVRHISRSDNRGSGRKTYGHYLKDVPDGKEVKIDPYIGFEDED